MVGPRTGYGHGSAGHFEVIKFAHHLQRKNSGHTFLQTQLLDRSIFLLFIAFIVLFLYGAAEPGLAQ